MSVEKNCEQIHNCDKSGSNFKMLTQKNLVSSEQNPDPGYKRSKEQTMILACCNPSGKHELKLTFIGMPKKLVRTAYFQNLSLQCKVI
jgi:hypothetical protein